MLFDIKKFILCLLTICVFNVSAYAQEQAVTVKMVVKKGELLESTNLQLVDYQNKSTSPDIITSIEDAENLQALRHLRPGMILRYSYVREKPMVNKNKQVKLIYNKPGIVLESNAKALQDGNLGDVIKVQNTQTNKIINATVIEENTATVN
jgi:flagella basal body P-ring formation protein FlgA